MYLYIFRAPQYDTACIIFIFLLISGAWFAATASLLDPSLPRPTSVASCWVVLFLATCPPTNAVSTKADSTNAGFSLFSSGAWFVTGSLLDPSLPQPTFVESCWVALFLAASVTSLDVKTLCLFGKSYTRIKIHYYINFIIEKY